MHFDWGKLSDNAWITAIVGGILSIILIKIPKTYSQLYLYFLHVNTDYRYGDWFCYVSTFREGRYVTVKYKMNIGASITVLHKVRLKYMYILDDVENLRMGQEHKSESDFEGYIVDEPNEFVITLHSLGAYKKSVHMRFPQDTIRQTSRCVTGIWLSYDHSLTTASGALILSLDELPLRTVKDIFKSDFSVQTEMPNIRMNDHSRNIRIARDENA